MKLKNLLSAIAVLFACASFAQTTLLTENFGTTAGTFPAGWTSSNATNGYAAVNTTASTGYAGSSGSVNARFVNTGSNGVVHTLTYSNAFSTAGYTAITVLWGARATATFSQPVTFEWSPDGTTWNPVTYTQVASTATWALVNGGTRIALPAGAENIPNLRFRFSTTTNNNGNYQIDDFTVQGTNAIISAQNGPWNTPATWVGGVVPTSAQHVIVNHLVDISTAITRNAGTTTSVSSGAVLSVGSNTYTNNGTTTIAGTFNLTNGGWATGNNFVYSGTGNLLVVGVSAAYAINNADVFWPAASGPYNVSIGVGLANVITMNAGMTRTIQGNLNLLGGLAMSPSALTVNGICSIWTNGSFNNNAPIYGAASTLQYQSGGTYGRGFEWSAAGIGTIGVTPGYPNNVIVTANTTLNYVNTGLPGTVGDKAMAGNLTVNSGSMFYMDYGFVSTGGSLIVGGNLTNIGTMTLGTGPGDDLKLAGNFANTGSFFSTNRAFFFTKTSGIQTVSSSSALTIAYVVFDSTGSRTVQMLNNLTISAPSGGNAIAFGSAADILDINGFTLTIGGFGSTGIVSGLGSFKGSTTSNMNLQGNGSLGTLNFTTGFQNLGTLTVTRSFNAVAFTLGTPLTVNTLLDLQSGKVHVGNFPLTLTSAATFNGGGNNNVVVDLANGANAQFRKGFAAAGSFNFLISDNSGNITPITTTLAGGTYVANAYVGVAVNDIKHPSYDGLTDFITRYWTVASSGITAPTAFNASGQYVAADVNTPAAEANYQGNKWDGAAWSNGGTLVNSGSHITNNIPCVAGGTNQVTAGRRDADINVRETATTTNYLNGSTYDFGTVVVGNTNAVPFTIQNLGQIALTLSPASPAPAAPFVYTTAYTNGAFTGPITTRTFTVTFTPTGAGTFTGSISIPNTDATGGENPYVINFTGVGVLPAPEINIKAASGGGNNVVDGSVTTNGLNNTAFGSIAVGGNVVKDFTIENLGTATLNLTGVPSVSIGGINPGDFTVTTAPASTAIGVASSTIFIITFTPLSAGYKNATVTITNDDSDENPYTFVIDGTGLGAEIDISGNGASIPSGSVVASTANDTQFGNVNVTSGSVTQIFAIANYGNTNLTYSAITITGPNAADFSFFAVLPSTLGGSTGASFTVTFNPTTIGVKNATVTVTNTDSNENPYTFAIQGTGIDYVECGLGLQEVIAQQDFEVSPAAPVMGFSTFQDVGAAAVFIGGGQAHGVNTATNTNKFIGARSYQVPGHLGSSGTGLTTTLEFATVDVSAYSQVSLDFRLGAYTTASNGLDVSPERVSVFVSIDNGATWSQEMYISGNSNSIWDINSSAGSATVNWDNNNLVSGFVPGAASLNTGPRIITINNLPSVTQLKIRITFALDRTDELWVVDDVRLQGRKPSISTWNGSAWTPGAPTSTTVAIINGNYSTASGNVNACSCQINAGNTVTINANQYFDVQNEITNNGTINIANNGSLIQRNDGAVNSGTAFNVTRNTTPYNKFDYTYWSSPVTNANIAATFPTWRLDYAFQFATANYADVIAPFDGFDDNGNAWLNVAGTMTPGKGYAIMAPTTGTFPATSTVTFNGAVNNGVVNMPVALSANAGSNTDDFNLIGNPYPSALYADQFIDLNAIQNTRISGTLYFWTHRTQISGAAPGPNANNFITADYAMYNLSGAVGTGVGTGSGTGSSAPTGFIASAQGFFVDAQAATNVVFNNGMRDESYANTNFFRLNNDNEIQKDRIWLNLESETGLFSQQLVGYFDNTTMDYDTAYDGIVNKTSNTISFYSLIGSDHYRIQARPSFDMNDMVPLGYSSAVENTYTISIENKEGQLASDMTSIYVEDKLLNIIHDLKQSAYAFTTEAGTFDDRFLLRYTNGTLGNPEMGHQSDVIAVTSGNAITVKSYVDDLKKITIYDIAGRRIFESGNISGNQFEISDIIRNNQALILRITLENGQNVTKKLIF